ncbi:ArsR/SmtB family transcription factor [Motilibacter aurantiacus]|uniref:ArsR/SmtB family transcription factor n=1 Tax=Motilibacter aurantiacus TaxID=2714955 RepID=UPI00140C6F63|nr:helix-turn-helix transcriptional regulator [Motilibacter aurantiacus]
MHLVPASAAGSVIDADRACAAIAAVGDRDGVRRAAARFALVADPGRLALLLAISRAGPVCVSDLAVAVDMTPTAVSQALRLLRAEGAVSVRREGRVAYYELQDPALGELLAGVNPGAALGAHAH